MAKRVGSAFIILQCEFLVGVFWSTMDFIAEICTFPLENGNICVILLVLVSSWAFCHLLDGFLIDL